MSFYFSVGLHTRKILDFCNFRATETGIAYLLALFTQNEDAIRGGTLGQGIRRRITQAQSQVRNALTADLPGASSEIINGQEFVGRWIKTTIQGKAVEVFCGVHRTHVTELINRIADHVFDPNGFRAGPFVFPPLTVERVANVSVLPDGTVLKIRVIEAV